MGNQHLLDVAAEICVTSHRGQRDKMGKAYFLHPMRVAMRCATDEERIVALLHDTIEDGDITAEYLTEAGFPQEIIDAVLSVTKIEGENYDEFIARAKRNPIGRAVKMHDLEDNLDVFRLDMLTPDMAARFTKYLAAYRFLQADEPQDTMEATEDEPVAEEEPTTPTEEQAATAEAVATLKPFSALYTALREEENKKIKSKSKHTGGTDYMQFRLIIRDRKRVIIDETSVFSTLCILGRKIGFDVMAESTVIAKKQGSKFRLVSKEEEKSKYTRIESGWYVLSNIPVPSAALALNELFESIQVDYIASIVDR